MGVIFSTGIIQTQADCQRPRKVRHTFSSEPEIKFQKWRKKKKKKRKEEEEEEGGGGVLGFERERERMNE